MSKWNKRRKGTPFSRKLVFRSSNVEERDLFLKLSMEKLREEEVKVDARLDRIELEVFGNRDHVEWLMYQLYELEGQIYRATNSDADTMYLYHPGLLSKLFKPPLSTNLWQHVLEIYGFAATVTSDKNISTDASLDDMGVIHHDSSGLLHEVPQDQHRDIQRFLIGIALETGIHDFTEIINQGLSLDLLNDRDGILSFAKVQDQAREELVALLNKYEPVDIGEDSGINFDDLLFDGGKIVFTRNGREIDETELDHSSYDGEDEKME